MYLARTVYTLRKLKHDKKVTKKILLQHKEGYQPSSVVALSRIPLFPTTQGRLFLFNSDILSGLDAVQ